MAQGGARHFEDMVALRVVSGACEAVAKPGFSGSLFPIRSNVELTS